MEKVILVDNKDNSIGEMEKIEAHSKALLHRAVSVFIFNSNNQLLLQKRALSKYHSPGLWTNTACTHPRPNENTKDAAIRRLQEEMGMSVDELTKTFDFVYKEKLDNELTEHELDHVFIGFSDNEPVPNASEVCEFKYVDKETILQQIQSYPNDYTVWFKKIIEQVLAHIK
ncbi:isopentenyl-diphosphate delta-isomerase [Balneicella halophila]|uniref:Isopentenyl-diphosphate delta-isomerase n=1 Tax=Balneicella halophila TaxID=1537566 RepID=A0A7L4UMG3_BALHA|nr:isopentenyl-diphosphate Delta-isomerase [Balneicella halophila]PVX49215.1 isopentenyl-diphosphate delta-isomerase [Balneicella halophila]